MKPVIIFIFLISFYNSYSQNLSKLDSKFQWADYEYRAFDSSDIEKVFPVVENSPFRSKSDVLKHLDFFHLIDYNNDYKIDILYNGWTGGEGEMLQVIKNTGSDFEIVQTIFGSVKGIKIENNKITEIEILDFSCCGGYVDHLQLWTLNDSSQYAAVNDLALFVGTKIPSQTFDKPIKFEIKSERYNMRMWPEIGEIKENEAPFDPIDGQNISASFTIGDTGVAIAEKEDNNGRIWWLVIMDQMPSNEYPKLFYDGNNRIQKYKPVGWISSRYVERLGK